MSKDDAKTARRPATLRKGAARRPQGPESDYSAMVEQAGDAFFVHDDTGQILDVNPKACELLEYTREELLGKTIQEIDPDLHAPHATQLWDSIGAGGRSTFDSHLERKDGTVIPVEITLSGLRSRDQRLFLGIVRDLTQRLDNEETYRQIIESMLDAAHVVGLDGRFLAVNEPACEFSGYSRHELLTMGPADMDTTLDWEGVRKLTAEVTSGKRQVIETGHRTKDGRTVPVEVALSPVIHLGKQAVLAVARDITHRKQAEDSLRALTRRNLAILQTIPDIIAEVDENKVYTWVNDAGLEFFGEGVIGREAAYYCSDAEATYAAVRPLFDGDPDTSYVESWQCRQDGQDRLLVWWCRALKDDSGRVIGALSTGRDITEKWWAEAVRDARLRLLEQAPTTDVSEFLRAALHEVEALTGSRIGFCNFLAPDEDSFSAAAWTTLDPNDPWSLEPDAVPHRVSGAGMWADCVRERRPLIYNDYPSHPQRKGTPPRHTELQRVLTVPLFRGGKVVAVFALGNKPSDYTERDIETVSSFADLVWDTVAQKQAEAALQESDAFNRRLFDASPDAVILSEPGGHFLDCNQTAIQNYGYSREELLRMTYRDLAAPELRDKAGMHVGETLKQRGTVFEWRHIRKDGSELPVEIRTVPFVASGEQRILATIRDLTQSKAAEEALQQSEERFKSLSSVTTEGIMIHDEGIIVDANLAFAELVGRHDADELIGKSGIDILPTTEASREELIEYIRSQDSPTFVIELVRPDGSTLWAETRGRAVMYRGRPARLVFMRDITESKRAEEAQERLETQLRQAAKMESIGRLAGGVAHDFNNMLAVIMGHVTLALEQVPPDDKLHADLLEIRRAAERSAYITQQLLGFARRQVVVPKVIDLNKSVQGMMGMLGRLIGERVRLTWVPGKNLGRVQIDPAQLDQVLVNLCLNARDAVSHSGRVTIKTEDAELDNQYCAQHEGCMPGRYVLLSVSDNGVGMSPDTLDHLFEPFFTTKQTGKGTGLGLPTVYGIVRQNDGFIQVETDERRGTQVRIFLPRVDAELTEEEQPPAPMISPGGSETLLVVEDEPSVLRLTARIMEELGYAVLTATSPSEALRVARENTGLALVITDVVMPEMTGWQLSDKLREIRPELKVLYVSGYTDETISGRSTTQEGIDFLQKPFTPQRLAETVRAMLDRK